MSDAAKRSAKRRPANDNQRPRLRAVVQIPPMLPIQLVELEVFSEFLDRLPQAANDNEVGE